MHNEFMELPEGWGLAKFGELILFSQNGCSERRGDNGAPTVVLRLADLSLEGKVVSPEQRYIPLSEAKKEKYELTRGDLLAFRVNGSRDIAGQVAYYQGPEGFAFCDHFIRFRLNTELVEPKFVATAFQVPLIRSQVEEGMVSSAGQNTVAQSTYASIDIPLPPFNEQKRIVAKIEELRDRHQRAKQALEAIPELCDRFRQSVLAAAFRGDLTADWRGENPDVEPASVLLERIKRDRRMNWETAESNRIELSGKKPTNDTWKTKYKEPISPKVSELSELPQGWEWTTLDQIMQKIVDGTHHTPTYTRSGIAFLSVKDIRNERIYFDDCRYISEEEHEELCKRCHPELGDLLITKSGTIGRCAVIETNRPFSLFVSVALLKPVNYQVLTPFISLAFQAWLQTINVQNDVTGSAIKNFHIIDFRELALPIPPLEEQKEIIQRVKALLETMNKIKQQYQETENYLDRLNQSILAEAFRGELVEQDPNDEPASVLLDRIRAEREKADNGKKTKGKRAQQLKLEV
jgi:type I restriction enzyme S subunit